MDNTTNKWIDYNVTTNDTILNNAMIRMTAHPMRILKSGLIQYKIWGTLLETEQTADISAKLVSFCLKENVCVVLLHHFKK